MNRWVKVSTNRLRGPHEGDELRLMLERGKPAALVRGSVWKREFAPYRLFQHAWLPDREYVVVVHKGDTWRMNRLVKEFSGEGRDHVKIGLLLGYSKMAIRFFMGQFGGNRIHSTSKR